MYTDYYRDPSIFLEVIVTVIRSMDDFKPGIRKKGKMSETQI